MTAAPDSVGRGRAHSDAASDTALDGVSVREAIEYCYENGWSDGLPVVPCTAALLEEFLAQVDRDPDEVLLAMPQLNRSCTVRLAAINAVMAGCRPEYFPTVLAAWDSLREEGYTSRGIWQSTTGTAPFLIANGPERDRIRLNSKGNVFGPGFRANATVGRAVRLAALNAFGLRPQALDQATQGTPAKYTCCIGENEDDTPWAPLHEEFGFSPEESTVTAMTTRSVLHVEARHTSVAEQLVRDLSDTVTRTGALLQESTSCCLVLSPEHANLLAGAGWSKRDVKRAVFDEAVVRRGFLDQVGKGAVSRRTRWRLPREHPDAVADKENETEVGTLRVLNSPEAVVVVVAGASNSGVSAVVETFGPRGGAPLIARIEERK